MNKNISETKVCMRCWNKQAYPSYGISSYSTLNTWMCIWILDMPETLCESLEEGVYLTAIPMLGWMWMVNDEGYTKWKRGNISL